jgi:methionyl aminopeptidase
MPAKDLYHNTVRTALIKDGWTITTADGKPSAHFEHDVAIVNGKPELLSTFAYIYEALGIVSNEEDGLREKPMVL